MMIQCADTLTEPRDIISRQFQFWASRKTFLMVKLAFFIVANGAFLRKGFFKFAFESAPPATPRGPERPIF